MGRAIDPARHEKPMRRVGNTYDLPDRGPTGPPVFDRSCIGGISIANRLRGANEQKCLCVQLVRIELGQFRIQPRCLSQRAGCQPLYFT